ncbi:aspartate 1-decarboxylase [Myxococcota bacterium]|nr:aspartate 1-decarboxylase [Myxococcota bacterium]MBU1534140.1 aspartate 1-decarboxylase [Myxococcota bacterium]
MSQRRMFKSKIHRAKVTQANLEYEGSITIDPLLLKAADILPYEEVSLWNVTRGTRLNTYAIEGSVNSGVVCVNGAAAHLVEVGDLIIIATFGTYSEEEALNHKPTVVLVDDNNRITNPEYQELPGPLLRSHS